MIIRVSLQTSRRMRLLWLFIARNGPESGKGENLKKLKPIYGMTFKFIVEFETFFPERQPHSFKGNRLKRNLPESTEYTLDQGFGFNVYYKYV